MRLTAVLLGTVVICLAGLLLAVFDYTRQGATSHASRLAPAAAPPALEPGLVPSPYPSTPAIVVPPDLVGQQPPAAVNGTGPVALTPAGMPATQTQPEAPPPQADGSNPPRGDGHGHGHGHDGDGGGD